MKARTHILKNITPNIFFDKRKVFAFLFFIMIHFVSANVSVPNIIILIEEEKSSVLSDVIIAEKTDSISPDKNIYITSGTTIIDLDNSVDGKVVIVESQVYHSKSKRTVKKATPEKVVKTVDNKKYVNQYSEKVVAYFYPSSQKNLHYSINKSYAKAVVPSQVSHSKIFFKSFNIIDFPANVDLIKIKNYSFYNQTLTIEFSNSLSGRAPPVSA